MKTLKKSLVLLLTFLLVLTTACGGKKNTKDKNSNTTTNSTTISQTTQSSTTVKETTKKEAVTTAVVHDPTKATTAKNKVSVQENGTYNSKDEVALYIHTYNKLPSNYIKKSDAEKLGWSGGSLEKYAPGKSIGGDNFGNYEKLLPVKSGRKYTECDIDTLGASSRGAKRIVFSNDGLIYYTDDHYTTFQLLYGNE